ncbi:MAG: aminotransferase class IV [Pseudomonadota bacterium]
MTHAPARTVWLNGQFMPEVQAKLPIFDRGLLFADAVYEGLGVLDGQIIDFPHHMTRLRRSLSELSMPNLYSDPSAEAALHTALIDLITRNSVYEGFLYLHITRGEHDRDYLYPEGLQPNIFAFTQETHDAPTIRLASAPDIRWARRDIKTTNLLGQVMAKDIARKAGADEALMVDRDGLVTECGAMSFFMIKDGALYARPLLGELLPGITRQTMLRVAGEQGLRIVEERYKLEETYAANEAFATGASSYLQPVIEIDGHQVGNGTPGPITTMLRAAYLSAIRTEIASRTRAESRA